MFYVVQAVFSAEVCGCFPAIRVFLYLPVGAFLTLMIVLYVPDHPFHKKKSKWKAAGKRDFRFME